MIQRKQGLSAAIAVALTVGSVGYGARAQQAPGNGGAPGGGGPRGGGNGGQNWQNMTPEERQQRADERLHAQLTAAGFTDQATQDAIVAYIDNQDKSKEPLSTADAKVVTTLREKTSTNDQVAAALASFRAAAATWQDQRKAALADLDGKIGYTKNPRLEAYLTIIGVVGDEASMLAQIGGGRGGNGGFGGFGGRGGNGGFGGRGGQGQGGGQGAQGAQGGQG